MDKKLYLSDMIRLGAAMKPQAFGALHDDNGGSCAMGAAMDGAGSCGEHSILNMPGYFDLINFGDGKCDQCDYQGDVNNLSNLCIVAHLNDAHKMSREDIADLVEAREVKLGIRPAVSTPDSRATEAFNHLIATV